MEHSTEGRSTEKRKTEEQRRSSWERFQQFQIEACGITLDYSKTSLDHEFLLRMDKPARQAIAGMVELEGGGRANPDEKDSEGKQGRRVGHYWLRASDRAPDSKIRDAIDRAVADVRAFAADVHTGRIVPENGKKIRHAIVIGIGGSALGPQLAADALGSPSGPAGDAVQLWYLDNTDPDGFDRTFAALEGELDATLAIVISKSGGTKETRNGMLEAQWAFERAGLVFASHAIAVTGEGSELDERAKADGWLRRFPMWDWVGGRTSQTAVVGLLPAALQGIDIDLLLEGARCMDEATRAPEPLENPAVLLALAWHCETGGHGERDMVVLPYKDRLVLLARYLQQLVMESLGKKHDLDEKIVHQGIAVYGNKGSTDQHSYVQQLRDGLDNFFVTFVEVQKDRADASREVEPGVTSGDYLHGFLLGTREALSEAERKSLTLTLPEVSPFTLGATIALFERAVGIYALLININAYHQPGVQAGKLAATKILELQRAVVGELERRAPAALSAEELAAAADAKPDIESPVDVELVFKVLEHLAANDRGIARDGGPRPADVRYGWSRG